MTAAPIDSVIIAIPTYRRAEQLAQLAVAVRDQAGSLAHPTRIVAVDNDPERSAEEVAQRAGIDYVAESRAGIGAVRSRALALSTGADLVVMIDDDVSPAPDWLATLVATWTATKASAVVGYVDYRWPEGTPDWIRLGGYMRRVPYPDAQTLAHVATGNVLIDAAAVRALGVDFATDLGLAGGEDTLFGDDLRAAGGTIVASSATVIDTIPEDRATPAFAVRRAISHGEGTSQRALRGVRGGRAALTRLSLLLGGVARWYAFLVMETAGRLLGRTDLFARGRRRRWFALGRIRGALGHRTNEYTRSSA